MDARIRYWFRISWDGVVLKEGEMLWEDAWRLSLNLCPCTVEVIQ